MSTGETGEEKSVHATRCICNISMLITLLLSENDIQSYSHTNDLILIIRFCLLCSNLVEVDICQKRMKKD